MKQEMKSLRDNCTWNLVQLPQDRKAVGSKWIYKIKIKADGSIERHKAQLVAQGYTQKKFGVDYDETFCKNGVFSLSYLGLSIATGHEIVSN